jgi:hypothetical protein
MQTLIDILVRIEEMGLSTWVRESPSLWAFPMLLFAHTVGVGIVAGGSAVIAFALLGLWPGSVPIQPLERLYPAIWAGFAVNVASGVAIFMKDASTYGRNPDFYIKLVLVAAGVVAITKIRRQVFDRPAGPPPSGARVLAWASLACWFGAIVAGRLIAYVGPVPGLF